MTLLLLRVPNPLTAPRSPIPSAQLPGLEGCMGTGCPDPELSVKAPLGLPGLCVSVREMEPLLHSCFGNLIYFFEKKDASFSDGCCLPRKDWREVLCAKRPLTPLPRQAPRAASSGASHLLDKGAK